MSLETEIEELQKQRDAELCTLKFTASRTKRGLQRAMDPQRQIRKHLGLAIGGAVIGGYLLAPGGSKKEKAPKARPKAESSGGRGGILEKIQHYFPQLATMAPWLFKGPPPAEQSAAGNVVPHAAAGETLSEDYGREEEDVRPFTPHDYRDVDSTPVSGDTASYEGFTSEEPPKPSKAAGVAGAGLGATLTGVLAAAISEATSKIDWGKIVNELTDHFIGGLKKNEDHGEPSVAIADAGTSRANERFGGRFSGDSNPEDKPKG